MIPSRTTRRKVQSNEDVSLSLPSSSCPPAKCSKCTKLLDRNKKSVKKLPPDFLGYAALHLGYSDTDVLCQWCFKKLHERIETEMSGGDYASPCRKRIRGMNSICIMSDHAESPCESSTDQLSKSRVDWQIVKELLNIENVDPPDSIFLCIKHKAELHRKMNPQMCCLCNENISHINPRCHSDSTIRLLQHFTELHGIESVVNSHTRLCVRCLKVLNTFSNSSENLTPIIEKCSNDLNHIKGSDQEDKENRALLQTALKLASSFQRGEASLLSDVFDWYVEFLQSTETVLTTSASNALTRSQRNTVKLHLYAIFGEALKTHKADNNQKSSMLYPSTIDPMKQLHESLFHISKLQSTKSDVNQLENQVRRLEEKLKQFTDRAVVDKIKDIADDMAGLIDQQATTIQKVFENKSLEDLPKLSLDELVKHLDPIVWNFICLLTSTQDEQKMLKQHDWCIHYFPKWKTASHALRRRMTRRIFLSYCMVFSKDEKTNGLQTLLSDKLNKYSLSADLMNFFNHLGVCVSYTTYRRFVENVSQKVGKDGPARFLDPGTFTVCTIDNIDKAMPGAAIKSTDSKRPAMHATGMMFFQPSPNKHSTKSTESASSVSTEDANTHIPHMSDKPSVLMSHNDQNSLPLGKVRPRSMSESGRSVPNDVHIKVPPMIPKYTEQKQLSLNDFAVNDEEKQSLKNLELDEVTYLLERTVLFNEMRAEDQQKIPLPSLKCKLFLEHQGEECEQSKYAYCPILYKHADSIHTMSQCVDIVRAYANQLQGGCAPLIVAGDAKTYVLLQQLKKQEGHTLDWLIPFIGDWHLLKNTQPILMKIFWDAGLKEIAKGNFKTEFFQQKLRDCTNFRITHHFLLQIWEAFYQYQILTFLKWQDDRSVSDSTVASVQECLLTLLSSEDSEISDVSCFIEKQKSLEQPIQNFQNEFRNFRSTLSEKDKTFQFWDNFVHKQLFSYIGLWIAIRSANWNLRMGCIKELAPLYHAYDRVHYAKIIPQHLADINRMPLSILQHLRDGGFVISLSGTPYASVALDEAHEMTINKDLKDAITLPSEDYVIAKSEFLPYRALLQKTLDELFSPQRKVIQHRDLSKSVILSEKKNVKEYLDKVAESKAYEVPVQGDNLIQLYTNKPANAEQERHLLNFEAIGQESLNLYIKLSVLKLPSDGIPNKRQNLKTFSKVRETGNKKKQQEQALKLKYMALRGQVAESKEKNLPISQIGQLIELPRAIADENKLPVKGQKSLATGYLIRRFKEKKVIFEGVIRNNIDTVILEGMFLINTSPRFPCRNFRAYAESLLKRWVVSWLSKGTPEIHIVFDDPERNGPSPKDVERSRRDQKSNTINAKEIDHITSDTRVPNCSWRDFLSNRSNKRKLCHFLSNEWCELISSQALLKPNQKFIVGGGFMNQEQRDYATCITSRSVDKKYILANHEEADTRVWLHASMSQGKTVQIFSPDTDTYHIGLTLVKRFNLADKVVYVQINKLTADFDKFVDMNVLVEQLSLDHELFSTVGVDGVLAPMYTQILYVSSGCDYVSYFHKMGKATFYRQGFKYADFIRFMIHSKCLLVLHVPCLPMTVTSARVKMMRSCRNVNWKTCII